MTIQTTDLRRTREKSLNEEFQVLIALVCESVGIFKLYDPKLIAVSVSRSRSSGKNGVWAYVVPLRYPGGAEFRRGSRRGRSGHFLYHSPQIQKKHPEALYLMTFLVPRFFGLSSFERLETIVHELYHLHPELRGDLRTFSGKHRHHGPTPHAYTRRVRELTTEALAQSSWLKEHPLIAHGIDYFAHRKDHHLAIPKRVFVCQEPRLSTEGVPTQAVASVWPRRRKNPATVMERLRKNIHSWLKSRALLLGIGALSLAPVSFTRAQNISATRDGVVLQSPASSSETLSTFSSGDTFRFVKASESKRWIMVQTRDGQRGWIPSNRLKGLPADMSSDVPSEPTAHKATPVKRPPQVPTIGAEDLDASGLSATGEFGGANLNASSNDLDEDFSSNVDEKNLTAETSKENGPVEARAGTAEFSDAVQTQLSKDDELDKIDRALDKFMATKKGKFFETPNKFAARYGIVEPGDLFEVKEKSKGGKWLKVRLLLTGEEGWYPKQWIKVVRDERMGRWNPKTFYLAFGYGTGGTRYGIGPSMFWNLRPQGLMGSPRDRLEVGFSIEYFFGENLETTDFAVGARYLRVGTSVRYVGVASNGFLGGAIEGGLQVTQSFVQFSGTTEDVLVNSGVRPSSTYFGALLGLTGFIAQSPSFQWATGFKVFFGTPSSVFVHLGPCVRF